MLLFQLPPRVVRWDQDPKLLNYPLNIDLEVVLNPPELFGMAEFTDSLRDFPTHVNEIRITTNLFAGLERVGASKPVTFEKFEFDGKFVTADLSVKGNLARFVAVCDDLESLYWLVQLICENFPGWISAGCSSPVSISEMKGSANQHTFRVTFADIAPGAAAPGVGINVHDSIRAHLTNVLPIVAELPIQIVAAMRYLGQSVLLESVSKYSYNFLGERILNLCKSVESITHNAGTNIDDMRVLLREWGVHERKIEVFVSIRHLRSKLDVAHIAYSPISADAYIAVDKFIPIAEHCTRRLVALAVEQFKANPDLYPSFNFESSDPTVIRRLAKYDDLKLTNQDLTTKN